MNTSYNLKTLVLGLMLSGTSVAFGPLALAACNGGVANGTLEKGELCDAGVSGNLCCTSECTLSGSTDEKCAGVSPTNSCPVDTRTELTYARIFYDSNNNHQFDPDETTLMTVTRPTSGQSCEDVPTSRGWTCGVVAKYTHKPLVRLDGTPLADYTTLTELIDVEQLVAQSEVDPNYYINDNFLKIPFHSISGLITYVDIRSDYSTKSSWAAFSDSSRIFGVLEDTVAYDIFGRVYYSPRGTVTNYDGSSGYDIDMDRAPTLSQYYESTDQSDQTYTSSLFRIRTCVSKQGDC